MLVRFGESRLGPPDLTLGTNRDSHKFVTRVITNNHESPRTARKLWIIWGIFSPVYERVPLKVVFFIKDFFIKRFLSKIGCPRVRQAWTRGDNYSPPCSLLSSKLGVFSSIVLHDTSAALCLLLSSLPSSLTIIIGRGTIPSPHLFCSWWKSPWNWRTGGMLHNIAVS